MPADLSSSCPLVAADAARAELEQACRRLLAAGWEPWRLRGQLERLERAPRNSTRKRPPAPPEESNVVALPRP